VTIPVYTYTVVKSSATVPEPGVRCLSCRSELQAKCINDVLFAYWCAEPECVRTGLLSNAWLPPAGEPTEAKP
jgi:hypothetical protein